MGISSMPEKEAEGEGESPPLVVVAPPPPAEARSWTRETCWAEGGGAGLSGGVGWKPRSVPNGPRAAL